MTTLLLSTRNLHKTEELSALLGQGFQLLTLGDFPEAPTVVEDATTFAGNAIKKSTELAKWLALSVNPKRGSEHPGPDFILADDSGLLVDALNGAPGVHSARFAALEGGAAANAKDAENNAKLLRLLEHVPLAQRTARFICVLALTPLLQAAPKNASPVCYADDFELQTEVFEGVCEGLILFAPRGQGGFGYDPLFIPEGYEQTFAEIGQELKNQISHRAKALLKLRARLGL